MCDDNCFCTGTTPAQTVAKVVPHVMGKSGKQVHIVAADCNHGQIIAQWMQKFVAEGGGETLAVEFFPRDVTSFGPTITKIQQAKPDFVFSALVGGAHVSFLRHYAAAGVNEALRTGLSHDGPTGAPTVDPKTHHGIQNVYLAELQDRKFNIIETHLAQPPSDTQLVCGLVANPDQATFHFENGPALAGIK